MIKNNIIKKINNEKGMTLMEVTIAVFLFSIFIVAFMSGQGDNINDSIAFKNDLKLKDIAEAQMTKVILDPPPFKPTAGKLVISKETKKFKKIEFQDMDDFEDYEVSVQIFKITIPDYEKITGTDEEEDPNQNQAIQKKIFNTFKKNMEKLVYQLLVTVRHKPSGATYDLSSWQYNSDANVQVNVN